MRSSHPDLARLILDIISLDYHETVMAAAGHQAEQNLHETVEKHPFLLVVEGAIPTKENGIHCMIGGAPFLMGPLEAALLKDNRVPVYAFSVRESVEAPQADGSVRKANVFRHGGFVS